MPDNEEAKDQLWQNNRKREVEYNKILLTERKAELNQLNQIQTRIDYLKENIKHIEKDIKDVEGK